MSFSAALQLSGLDDHINPSVACIKPVPLPEATQDATLEKMDDGSFVEIHRDGTKKPLQPAKITLNDCLACSGCITSAETILVTQQSSKEFLVGLTAAREAGNQSIVSVSPQTWSSLAAHFQMSGEEAAGRLVSLLRHLGADMVLDISYSRDIALIQSCSEFEERWKSKQNLPMIASACPGWVCYAEKLQHNALPYISYTKSPQQIAGTIIKDILARERGWSRSNIYHSSVMPCFDKKLEAARADFVDDASQTRDVDLVITPIEILEILSERNIDFGLLPVATFDSIAPSLSPPLPLFGVGGVSGSFAETIFKFAAKKFYGQTVENVEFKQLRNPDFSEAILEVEGQVVLRFALCYGFRNIQNIVRQLKSSKGSPFHFVEIMACPSGCVNGGGQVRPPDEESPIDRLKKVKEIFKASQQERSPWENPIVQQLYERFVPEGPLSTEAHRLFSTRYHAVSENLANPLTMKW